MNLAFTFSIQLLQSLNKTIILFSSISTPTITPPTITNRQSTLSVVQMPFPSSMRIMTAPCMGFLTYAYIPLCFNPSKPLAQYEPQVKYLQFKIYRNLNGIMILPPSYIMAFISIITAKKEIGRQIHSGIVNKQMKDGQRLEKMYQRTSPLLMLQTYLSQRAKYFDILYQLTLYLRVAMRICCNQKRIQSAPFLRQCVYDVSAVIIEEQFKKGNLNA